MLEINVEETRKKKRILLRQRVWIENFRLSGQWALIFYVLLTVHLSIILANDQLDTQLLYFTIYLLHSSTCFDRCLLIIKKSKCTDATGRYQMLHQYSLTS
jgi:muramidase (phage lysozyme)